MQQFDLWKIFVTLGVPGVALGLVFFLFQKFSFRFTKVPKKYTGPIAIIFMFLITCIVFYALHLWSPKQKNGDQINEGIGKGSIRSPSFGNIEGNVTIKYEGSNKDEDENR